MDRRHIPLIALALLLLIPLTTTCDSKGATPPRPTSTWPPVLSPEPTNTLVLRSTATASVPTQVGRPSPEPEPSNTSVPREPTDTPMPIQTPQVDTQIHGLFEEVYFSGAGGAVSECMWWVELQQPEPPAVGLTYGRRAHGDTRVICLWGFSLYEQVTVSFYAPNGDLLISGDFIADKENTVFQILPGGIREAVGWIERLPESNAYENKDVIGIDVAWPVILPAEGHISAVSASAYAEAPLHVGLRRVSVLPAAWEDIDDFFGLDGCFAFSAGDEALILGTGFEPNSSLPLGVYLVRNEVFDPGRLVLSEIVNTNDQGDFSMSIQIEQVESSDPAECYYVLIVATDPGENVFCPTEEEDILFYPNCSIGPLACFQVW
jgi:hypothetical protein